MSTHMNSSFSKITAWNFSIKVWIDGFKLLNVRWLFHRTITYFVPFIGILIGREYDRVQLIVLVCRFPNPKFSKPASRILPTRFFSRFFVNNGFLEKLLVSVFMLSNSGKYRRATAPLVFYLLWNNGLIIENKCCIAWESW